MTRTILNTLLRSEVLHGMVKHVVDLCFHGDALFELIKGITVTFFVSLYQ